jgi:hypothetical protein
LRVFASLAALSSALLFSIYILWASSFLSLSFLYSHASLIAVQMESSEVYAILARTKNYEPFVDIMSASFRDPTPEEAASSGEILVGRRISLWWDGDEVFYPCKVISFDSNSDIINVKYDNDDSGPICEERLGNQSWKIWTGTDEEFEVYNQEKIQVERFEIRAAMLSLFALI